MRWLAPIGFLGLLGILALIVIYIVKPNYQNKYVSSTFIWRQSLKYRKRSLPINKIQSIFTFLIQMGTLLTLGIMLAWPVLATGGAADKNEAVIIVDASAGMRISDSQKTRYERALAEAKEKTKEVMDSGSRVSFIIASDTPTLVFAKEDKGEEREAIAIIDSLIEDGADACSYKAADIDGAVELAESLVKDNPSAKIYLYTGTSYIHHDGVEIVGVGSSADKNGAILGCEAEMDSDNHYKITVRAALYGKSEFLTVYCKVHGVNGNPDNTVTLEKGDFFDPLSTEKDIVFTADDMTGGAIYSYDYIEAYINGTDSMPDDNYVFLYGGTRPVIKVQYASSSPNNFFESAMRSLRQNKRAVWDIQYTSLTEGEEYATEGFDLYIFEHEMPPVIPTDGVVWLVDPDFAPDGSGLQIGSAYEVDSTSPLSPGVKHPITDYTDPTRITIAKYNDIILSEDYTELAFYNGRPVMLLKENKEEKILVWAFDLNYSNNALLPDFAFLTYNIFNHFFPETFKGDTFEVGDTVSLTGRGEGLKITDAAGEVHSFDTGEGKINLTLPGTYTVQQAAMNGKDEITEEFFVKIPSAESNPDKTVDTLYSVEIEGGGIIAERDLLVYLAIFLVLLLAVEWVLEIKKNY